MKRMFMVMGLFVLLFTAARAQEKKFGMYAVGFYNQENLFDTIHDEGKNDFEYLPDGAMKWNGMKYFAKLKNMATVLSEMGTDKLPNIGASVIGRIARPYVGTERRMDCSYRRAGQAWRRLCADIQSPFLYTGKVVSATLYI